MKYIAIIDDEFLSNFRVDVKGSGCDLDMILVVQDDRWYQRGIRIQPIGRPMIVNTDGNSAYLNHEHIDCLLEMERKHMFDEVVKNVMNSFRREE